jgi:hypothetical protein
MQYMGKTPYLLAAIMIIGLIIVYYAKTHDRTIAEFKDEHPEGISIRITAGMLCQILYLAIIVFYVRDAGIPYLTARAQMGDFVPANISSGYIKFDDYYRTANI